jgi:hypothetical protein
VKEAMDMQRFVYSFLLFPRAGPGLEICPSKMTMTLRFCTQREPFRPCVLLASVPHLVEGLRGLGAIAIFYGFQTNSMSVVKPIKMMLRVFFAL